MFLDQLIELIHLVGEVLFDADGNFHVTLDVVANFRIVVLLSDDRSVLHLIRFDAFTFPIDAANHRLQHVTRQVRIFNLRQGFTQQLQRFFRFGRFEAFGPEASVHHIIAKF